MSDSPRYRRVRTLGRGSFGEVFEAEDSLLGRSVAVKVLPFAERIPVLAHRALLTEARMAAAAGRSSVQVFDLVAAGEETWLVMEYIDGGSLHEWVTPQRTKAELRSVVGSIADRLAVMHDLGLIHGDIHPRNLLVRANDDVALSDFGLARMAAEASSKRGAHEIHWSAPEVLNDGRVSPAADVYSFALVIDWLYQQAGQPAPAGTERGRAADLAERPPDGRAFARLLEPGPVQDPTTRDEDGSIDAELRRAADAARSGRTAAAKDILDTAIRLAPVDPRPRRRLALVRWMSGEKQSAIWALESAQRLDRSDRLTATMLHNWRDAMEDE